MIGVLNQNPVRLFSISNGRDLAESLERPENNAKIATVLGLISASSGKMESEVAPDETVLKIAFKINLK
jgi:hypothetical protein